MLRFTLIKTFFPEMTDDARKSLFVKWYQEKTERIGETATSAYTAKYLRDVLSSLNNEPDFKDFSDIKDHMDDVARQEFILSRVGHAKALAENFTPRAIKDLRPGIPGCVLVWQYSMGSFQGYYPIVNPKVGKEGSKKKPKTHYSRSRNYNVKRPKAVALVEIVRWLWKLHEQNGGETKSNIIHFFFAGSQCFPNQII